MSEITFDFHGKNFAVTGASSGIGKQIALELLAAGANVLVVARRKALLDKIYTDYANQAVTAALDVRQPGQWEDVLSAFVAMKGKLHGTVYCAGISGISPLRALDEKLAHDVVETNFFGAVGMLRYVTNIKYADKQAAHVWIASVAAQKGAGGESSYSASKGAMVSAMHSLVKEISKRGQRLNTVSPAWVETAFTLNFKEKIGIGGVAQKNNLLGVGQPEDVSGVVLFLLSDRARWMTGSDVVVDGGYLSV